DDSRFSFRSMFREPRPIEPSNGGRIDKSARKLEGKTHCTAHGSATSRCFVGFGPTPTHHDPATQCITSCRCIHPCDRHRPRFRIAMKRLHQLFEIRTTLTFLVDPRTGHAF